VVALGGVLQEARLGFRRAQSGGYFLQEIVVRTICVSIRAHTLSLQNTKMIALPMEQALGAQFALCEMSLNPWRGASGILVRTLLYLKIAQVSRLLIGHVALLLTLIT
jgi:hypothetical protein